MLEKIRKVNDIKKLNIKEKIILADEIREYLIGVVSNNGGHLASNLGVVELTIALESVDFSKVMELPERYKGSDLRSRVALVQKYIEEIGELNK